jgi:hypothetical protein
MCVFIVIGSAAPLVAAKERRSFSFLISSFISSFFFLPISVPDYLVVIQIKQLIVLSHVLHALEVHSVPQNT